jgi:alcohol dehydrogenase
MTKTMRAARMHEVGGPLTIDEVPIPDLRPKDVLIEVRACGIVPNLKMVLTRLHDYPELCLPPLPAIFGLDVSGVVARTGEQVNGFEPGDRVYINPARYCGDCRACRRGDAKNCSSFAYNGYFGFSAGAAVHYREYPHGGMAEYLSAPQYSLVKLPENVSFEDAARWGYMGTAYSALRQANVGPGTTVLINGISGTLGLPAALLSLALGARKILGTGRNRKLLDDVAALAPRRIEVYTATDDITVAEWARMHTDGEGVDAVIDALFTGSAHQPMLDALGALRYGGVHVNIGGVTDLVPVNVVEMMWHNITLKGSNWFTTAEANEMADIAAAGLIDFSVFEHEIFELDDVNNALALFENRHGGFSNYVIRP